MKHWQVWMFAAVALCVIAGLVCMIMEWAKAEPEAAAQNGPLVISREITVQEGQRLALPAGDGEALEWSCGGDAVLLFDGGVVLGISEGTSLVTADSADTQVVFRVTVTSAPDMASVPSPTPTPTPTPAPSPTAEPVQTPTPTPEPTQTPAPTLEVTAPADAPWMAVSGSTPWLVAVNCAQNCVTVFEKDETGRYARPVRAMVCSTGADTPRGTYNLSGKLRWCSLFGDVWGQYISGIVGDILFHSVPYTDDSPDTLKWDYYNLLGTTCSMGCVRLVTADAYWIFENCAEGTPVLLYDSQTPGPLGKPAHMTLESGCGWDPTDPNPENPWIGGVPVITGVRDLAVRVGTEPALLTGVTATDPGGGDLTARITVTSAVDITRNGSYSVTYTVTDCMGGTATAQCIVTVSGEANSKPKP